MYFANIDFTLLFQTLRLINSSLHTCFFDKKINKAQTRLVCKDFIKHKLCKYDIFTKEDALFIFVEYKNYCRIKDYLKFIN
ncbi:MAG: hypothetical protein B7Z06_11310 [Flavobacteriales bacterium 32-35-8]|nr:MAG: hypothetical protein B7Z06_11310 [Flavobacteriales bacterium 32-35-8]